ncbi:hypothetical protein vseg_003781 [Gypsophila vaccaria]
MWQIQSFSGKTNNDSDQSISDEEDDDEQDCTWPQKCVSLAGTLDSKKESVGVASQLELLKGFRQDVGFSSEDEVEIPEFHNMNNVNRQCFAKGDSINLKTDDSSCEQDEQFSNIQKGNKHLLKSVADGDNVSVALNLYARGKEKQTESCTQSAIYKNSMRLNPSTETAGCSTDHPFYVKEKNPSKGGRRKSVAGSSSHVEPYKKGMSWFLAQTDKDCNSISSDELLYESDAINSCPNEKTSHFEDSHDEISKSRLALPVGAVMRHDDARCSMVELLDHIQGKNSRSYQKCETGVKKKSKIRRNGVIRNLPSSTNNFVSDEDADEFMSSGSSTDTEVTSQNLKPVVTESGRKTMADKFQEAFGSAPVLNRNSPLTGQKLLSTGLFGRLQHVMQCQKEQDAEFLKNQHIEVWPKDEAKCIDVKILSRSFDAKLTVCLCSLLENEESSVQNPHQESFQKTWTIIFNSRVCGDVDLEVGNLIRVHPPWKEVQVLRCGEIIILATYFSQV